METSPSENLPAWLTDFNFQSSPIVVVIKADEILFRQGETADFVYIVLAGALSIKHRSEDGKEIEIDKLFADDIVGEIGLMSTQSRTATVAAMVDTKLLQISAADFERFRSENEASDNPFMGNLTQRWKRLQLSSILTKLFGDLDVATVHELQDRLIWHNVSTGDMLCQQNDSASSMYIIVNGRFQFYTVNESGEHTILGHAERGETIGEYALITHNTRSATIRAVRESVVVEMTQEMYQQWSVEYPQLIPSITNLIVERQLRNIGHVSPDKKAKLNLTLFPIDPTVDMSPFLTQLQTALETFGKTKIINASTLNKALGHVDLALIARNDPLNTAITQWLSDQEAQYDFLLFQPDQTWSMWTQRCIGQSDKVLVLGQPTGQDNVDQNEIEQYVLLQNIPLKQELVLWHPAETEQPANTLNWLDAREHISRHHHIRDSDQAHFSRLARSLAGQSIGVVFSGGGARGYVQLGVLAAMRDLTIPVDFIGGASFGSLTSAAGAMELDAQAIHDLCEKFGDSKYTQDITFPVIALNKSEGLYEMTKAGFGDLKIEDLWIPYFAIVSNLTTATAEVLDRGPLWLAIRKSIAVPGVYTPIFENGDIIVDGGVMNNFPLDVMADILDSQRIIGVSITPLQDKKREYEIGYSVSGWKILFNKINPFTKTKRMPSLSGLLLRTMEVNSVRSNQENAKLADLLMIISPKKIGFLDFARHKEIIEIGYEASLERLTEWKGKQADLIS